MWRSLFVAVGLCMCILGAECLVVDKAVMAGRAESSNGMLGGKKAPAKVIVPPDWAPWSLLSAGAVIMLYSFTIPSRMGGK